MVSDLDFCGKCGHKKVGHTRAGHCRCCGIGLHLHEFVSVVLKSEHEAELGALRAELKDMIFHRDEWRSLYQEMVAERDKLKELLESERHVAKLALKELVGK